MHSAIPDKETGKRFSEETFTFRSQRPLVKNERRPRRGWLLLLTFACGAALCDPLVDELAKARDAYRTGEYGASIRLYRSLAEQGSAEAQTALAKIYRAGKAIAKDDAEAVSWFRRAADQGHAEAQTYLGLSYARGQGVSRDDDEAVRWYRLAAEQSYAWGQTNLGYMYSVGRGVARDDAAAVEWYRKAAAQSFAMAQDNLGVAHRDGRGVPHDDVEAVKWFRLAAEQDYAEGQNNLGVMYQRGNGVAKDYSEAVRWYRKAADRGLARAQGNLGFMYEEGRGVAQDNAQAVEWFGKAAAQNYAPAQAALGRAYEGGVGVAQNNSQAARWYRLAADQGNAIAQARLGRMYGDGRGVEKDLAAAQEWLRKASAQGSQDAQRMLSELDEERRSLQPSRRIATLIRLMRADDSIIAAIASGAKTLCKKLQNDEARQCEASAALLGGDIDRQRLVELLAPFFVAKFTDDEIEAMIHFYDSEEGRALTTLVIEGMNWNSPRGPSPPPEPPMTEKLAAYLQSPVSRKLTALAAPFGEDAIRHVGPYLCTVIEPRGFSCTELTRFAAAAAAPALIGMAGSQTDLQSAEDIYQRDADIVRARNLLEWARIIEAYKAKSGRYPLQARAKGDEIFRVRIATREQQAYLDPANSIYDRATALDDPRLDSVSVKELVADIEAVLEREIEERYDPQRVPNGAPIFLSYFATKEGYLIWTVCRTCPSQSYSFTIPLRGKGFQPVQTINIGSRSFIDNVPKTQSIDSLQANKEFVGFIGKGPARKAWFEELERAQTHESKN